MIKKLAIIVLFVLISIASISQENDTIDRFSLSDTSFYVGQVYTFNTDFLYTTRPMGMKFQREILDSVILFLQRNSNIVVEIGIHTDTRGSDTFLLKYSQEKADYLYGVLVELGVNEKQITAVGYGKSKPLIHESDIWALENVKEREYAHTKNRRGELKILR